MNHLRYNNSFGQFLHNFTQLSEYSGKITKAPTHDLDYCYF